MTEMQRYAEDFSKPFKKEPEPELTLFQEKMAELSFILLGKRIIFTETYTENADKMVKTVTVHHSKAASKR